jgi:Rrf2 family transcriptional regulator, iron-sulfur cluster assembly transcription factor
MLFSKSFGYCLRGVLYIAAAKGERSMVSLDEIARHLQVPRHFLGKVLKRLVKSGVIDSRRGTTGGFTTNTSTLHTNLYRILEVTNDALQLETCIVQYRRCNPENPCPLHHKIEPLSTQWQETMKVLTIEDLLKMGHWEFLPQ